MSMHRKAVSDDALECRLEVFPWVEIALFLWGQHCKVLLFDDQEYRSDTQAIHVVAIAVIGWGVLTLVSMLRNLLASRFAAHAPLQ